MSDCDKNCEAIAGLNEYAANLIEYSKRIDRWLNGGQNEFVDVGGVQTPTLRNLVMAIKQLVGVWPDNLTIKIDPTTKKIYVPLVPNGGVHVAENGGLYINASDFLQLGGGLAKDPVTGEIYVDFSQMPTDKFEALLKSIKVPIWLNGNTTFYVNKTHSAASDSLTTPADDGRGLTPDKPFKTIQAAINYVINNYNMVNFIATVLVAPGNYEENLTLGQFSKTTGFIVIRPSIENYGQVNILAENDLGIDVYGGPYYLVGLNVNFHPVYTGPYFRALRLLNVGATGEIHIRACHLEISNINNIINLESQQCFLLMLANYGGKIRLDPSLENERQTSFKIVKPDDVMTVVFWAERNAIIEQTPTNINATKSTILVEGSCNQFIHLINAKFIRVAGAAYWPSFAIAPDKTFTGQRYYLEYGSSCQVLGAGNNYFPGNSNGFAQSETYCWYY